MNSKLQRDAYQKNINEVFKKQINYISNEGPIMNDSDDSDEEFNQSNNIKPEFIEEESNKNFMNNLHNKKKKKMESKR